MGCASGKILGNAIRLGLSLTVALGLSNAEAQITDIYSPSVQTDINGTTGPGLVQEADGWYYTNIVMDDDGDPGDPDEADEGEIGTVGPFASPNNNLPGIAWSIPGDANAPASQADDTKNDTTLGGPVDLASGAETDSHTVLSLSGARSLEFTISYNSQVTAGNKYIATPSGGGSPYWSLYTPGDLGHWTHNFDGQAAFFAGTGGTAGKVILMVSHRRWTFLKNGSSYQTFDQASAYDSLVLNGDGSYTLKTKDQTTYTFSGPGLYLTKITNPHAQAIVIARNGSGQITTITEPVSGKSIAVTYGTTGNSTGRIASVTDSAGRAVSFTYDANGMLTQVTEANGGTTSYTYDSGRHMLTEADAHGNILTTNYYNADGSVFTQLDARGNTLNFSYSNTTDTSGNVITSTFATDRMGRQSTYVYDENHNLISFTSNGGNTTTYTYDSNGNVLTKTDPLGHVTSYAYDSKGNVILITDALNQQTVMTYDSRNNLLTVTNPNHNTSTFTYDSRNNLLTATDSLGHKVVRTYDSHSLQLTQTNPNGGLSRNTYTSGLLTSRKDAAGNTETMTYDAVGNLATTTDPIKATTTFHYGPMRELLEVDDAAGNKVLNTYDWRLRKLTTTDPSGAVTTYAYDGNNNILSIKNALNQTTTFTYDNEDRPLTVTDPLGNVSSKYYDADGRLIQTTDAANDSVYYAYDGANNLLTVNDGAYNVVATNTYDARNQLLTSTDALGRQTTLTYDNAKLLVSKTDPLGHVTSFVHDALGRTSNVNAPLATTTSQTFDADGNRATLVNPNQKSTAFSYDVADRLTKTTTPAGNSTTYTYNSRSLPSSVTLPVGSSTTFTYDSLGRVSTATDPVGKITYSYDKNGRITHTAETIAGSTKTIVRHYDLLGRMILFIDGDGNSLSYAYDKDGNLTTLTYPDGKKVTYGYDAARRLVKVTDWANRVTSYYYDFDSRVVGTVRPDGSYEATTYDAAGQIVENNDVGGGSIIIHDIVTSYDLGGKISGEATTPAPAIDIPSALSLAVDADNRLTTINAKAATYDQNGNLTQATIPGSSITTLTYDARNRLTSAGGQTYAYDAENRRVSITTSAGTAHYVTNPLAGLDQVLIKTAPNGTVTRYVYGLGLIGEETNSAFTTYHYDHRGSTTALTDSNGNVLQTFSYGPDGEPVGFSPSTASTPFLYGGRYGVMTDASGINYMRARYYLAAIARFVNQDTMLGMIESGMSMNRFAYANGDPIDKNDPFGLDANALNPGQILGQFGHGLLDSLKGAAVGTFQLVVNVGGTIDYGIASLFDQNLANQFAPQVQGLQNTANGFAMLGSQLANGDFSDIGSELTGGEGRSGAYRAGSATGSIGLILAGGALGDLGAAAEGTDEVTTVIGRVKDLQDLGPGEQSLLDQLPDLGDPKANWHQNSGVLRQAMNKGVPIRDASPGDTSGQFLNAERNLLQNHGWTFDPNTNFWNPSK